MSTKLGMNYPCGTYLAYRHNPCRCQDCTTAWTLYDAKRRLRHTRGEVWADTGHYQQILAPFANDGVGHTAIARAVGADANSGKAARRLIEGSGHVGVQTARQFDGLTWDDFPDGTKVNAQLASDLVAVLEGRGWSRNAIGRKVLGWKRFDYSYPQTARVTLGVVRKLERALGREEHGWHNDRPCDDCGELALAGGFFCLRCLNLRVLPQTKREIALASRREHDRRERAKYRARRDAA